MRINKHVKNCLNLPHPVCAVVYYMRGEAIPALTQSHLKLMKLSEQLRLIMEDLEAKHKEFEDTVSEMVTRADRIIDITNKILEE